MIPMLDMGWVAGMAIGWSFSMMIAIPLGLCVESAIIWFVLNLTFWRSIKDAVVINIVSVLFGFVYLTRVGGQIETIGGSTYSESTSEGVAAFYLFVIGIPYVLSIIIEGFTLFLMEKGSPWHLSLLISFLGNTASYMILIAIMFFPRAIR